MKPNELRIGNYIIDSHNGNIGQVTSGKVIDNLLDILKPIPLTEQWLLDFGFEKYYETVECGINEELEGFKLGDLDIMQDVYGNWFMCGMEFNVNRFKHVHQLQNLYFALTGEELAIKEKV